MYSRIDTKKQNVAQLQKEKKEELFTKSDGTSTSINMDPRMREQQFMQYTEQALDDYIMQGRMALGNIQEQGSILKSARKKILDTANTLGLNRTVIKFIERRTAEDKWIFYIGALFSIFIMWSIIHFLT